MKIATLNIDWARSHNKVKIENFLTENDFDILIITEAIDLKLPLYPFQYKTKDLPRNEKFEGFDYFKLKEATAHRTIIYSKYESVKSFDVTDEYTSVCRHFNTPVGEITIYATIIGTMFRTLPYAKKELDNCIADCNRIFSETKSLCLVGDLNTSFNEDEKSFQINNETTAQLRMLCDDCQLDLTTASIEKNIDHILLSKEFIKKKTVAASSFVEKGKLSDHQGIVVEIL